MAPISARPLSRTAAFLASIAAAFSGFLLRYRESISLFNVPLSVSPTPYDKLSIFCYIEAVKLTCNPIAAALRSANLPDFLEEPVSSRVNPEVDPTAVVPTGGFRLG